MFCLRFRLPSSEGCSDRWIASGGSPTRVRKTLATLGNIGMGIFPGAAALHGRCFYLDAGPGGTFMGASACNVWAMTQTLAGPRMVGRWTGVQNFVGNFAGAVAPNLQEFSWTAPATSTGRFSLRRSWSGSALSVGSLSSAR